MSPELTRPFTIMSIAAGSPEDLGFSPSRHYEGRNRGKKAAKNLNGQVRRKQTKKQQEEPTVNPAVALSAEESPEERRKKKK